MLDAPVARLRRALTLRRLYRCRRCDALFEALSIGGGERRGRGPESHGQNPWTQSSNRDAEVGAQRLVEGRQL